MKILSRDTRRALLALTLTVALLAYPAAALALARAVLSFAGPGASIVAGR